MWTDDAVHAACVDQAQRPLTKNILAECPWIETITPTEVDGQLVKPSIEEHQKTIELLDEPRIFKQHVDWSEIATSTDPKIQSSIRYITITRDIRDVPYSMFEHLTGMTEDMSAKMRGTNMKIPDQFDAFFDWWINGPSENYFKCFVLNMIFLQCRIPNSFPERILGSSQ